MQTNLILTPRTLWADFNGKLPLKDTRISEEKINNYIFNEVYFSGRLTTDGRVLIYGIYAHIDDGKKHSAVLLIPDIGESTDIKLIMHFLGLGYNVLMLDYRGDYPNTENYTGYPSDIKFANYIHAGRHIDFVDDSAKDTCWYEWVGVFIYGVSFLKKQIETNKIGVLGIGRAATIMWQLVAVDGRIDCGVSLFEAGWSAYRGIGKVSGEKLELNDERYRYIAGIDAHSYAQYCKCPILLVTATNSEKFDIDRAHDTLLRLPPETKSYMYYSPRQKDVIDDSGVKDIELFFGVYLSGQKNVIDNIPDLDIVSENNIVEITGSVVDGKKIKNIELYVCEGQFLSSRRNWVKIDVAREEEEFSASYSMCNGGGVFYTFCNVEYRSGMTLSSKICTAKIGKANIYKTNLIYSGQNGLGDWLGIVPRTELIADCLFAKKQAIEMVKGPMNIFGLYSKYALGTYKLNEQCVSLDGNSIFLFDISCRENLKFSVSLSVEVNTVNQKDYYYDVDVSGGEVWQNILVNITDFKSTEGFSIKNYGAVDYMTVSASGKFLINNVLII